MTNSRIMRAMVFTGPGQPLRLAELPVPQPAAGELLLRVAACGICRTDLHIIDGELTKPVLPLVPGHQIVGVVADLGPDVTDFRPGDRVGVPWLGGTCGNCDYCRTGQENLCDHAVFTGYQRNGGFAEYCTASAPFCFPLPENYPDLQAAPLLCAGLIGYRAWWPVRTAPRLGLYGFGAAAHLVTQLARHAGQRVFAFTRPGDAEAQAFARSLGAEWAGGWRNCWPRSNAAFWPPTCFQWISRGTSSRFGQPTGWRTCCRWSMFSRSTRH